MKLCDLLSFAPHDPSFAEFEIDLITESSAKAAKNSLFVCISGSRADGHAYAEGAYQNGCRVFLAERELSLPSDALVVRVENTRRALALLACQWYHNPSHRMHLIGITGTKGKTTTAQLLSHILNQSGIPCGYIGTNGIEYRDVRLHTKNTTPDAMTLQSTLADMRSVGVTTAVIEVSSQAILHHRIAGMRFETVLFTNLSPDHIGENEHADLADYVACKHRLFTDFGAKNLIYNADDPSAQSMIRDTSATLVRSCSLRQGDVDFSVDNTGLGSMQNTPGISFDVFSRCEKTSCELPLIGKINASNAMLAMATANAVFGISLSTSAKALPSARVSGRSQLIALPNEAFAVIDYAHNGESLKKILGELKEYRPSRLIAVFGSIGGRARMRRAELGRAAAELCDLCILTSDNPADEDPEAIIDDIAKAFSGYATPYLRITDREEAIKHALRIAQPGDIILFAGKGHEEYQLIGNEALPFSEKEIIMREIQKTAMI